MSTVTTVALVALTVAVAVLALLVTGLLRSHAAILRRLHELGAGLEDDPAAADDGASGGTRRQTPGSAGAVDGRPAADLSGVGPRGGALALRATGVEHDTVLAFLSSGCETCRGFWDELRDPGLPAGTRPVVVTRGPDAESPAAVADLAPEGVPVVMSSGAWEDYEVPGAPYVVHVAGPPGRVRGEGTAGSWQRARRMLLQAADDRAHGPADGPPGGGGRHGGPDRHRAADRALLAAGIRPGDPSLYPGSGDGPDGPAPDGDGPPPGRGTAGS